MPTPLAIPVAPTPVDDHPTAPIRLTPDTAQDLASRDALLTDWPTHPGGVTRPDVRPPVTFDAHAAAALAVAAPRDYLLGQGEPRPRRQAREATAAARRRARVRRLLRTTTAVMVAAVAVYAIWSVTR